MISRQEIEERARKRSVDSSRVERDYCVGWLLCGMSRNQFVIDHLVITGATALKKLFPGKFREASDLQFTSNGDFGTDCFRRELLTIVGDLARQTDISYTVQSVEYHNRPGSSKRLRAAVEYVGPLSDGVKREPIVIGVETSAPPLAAPMTLEMRHPYTDRPSCSASIRCHALEEIAADKLRAAMLLCRPADIYDAWYLTVRSPQKLNFALLRAILHQKRPADPVGRSKLSDFLDSASCIDWVDRWEQEVSSQLANRPDFQQVIKDLQTILALLC